MGVKGVDWMWGDALVVEIVVVLVGSIEVSEEGGGLGGMPGT